MSVVLLSTLPTTTRLAVVVREHRFIEQSTIQPIYGPSLTPS
jgi:hypothetical protein